jgi:hypothetical protein
MLEGDLLACGVRRLLAEVRGTRLSRTTGSTALNGSSISITGGSAASARATPTRCCCPPDSCAG